MNLLREIADVLIRMKMLSEGKAGTAPDAVRGRLSEPDHTPRLAGGSLFEEYAGNDGELTRLVYRMQRDLQRATHSRGGAEHREDRDKRIIKDYQGWPATKVAEWERLGHQTVRDIRRRHDRNPSDGV